MFSIHLDIGDVILEDGGDVDLFFNYCVSFLRSPIQKELI